MKKILKPVYSTLGKIIGLSTIDGSWSAQRVPTDQLIASAASATPVVMTNDSYDGTLRIKGSGNLTTLTITLPTPAVSRIGQRRCIASFIGVNTLTINGATTINNPPGMLFAGDIYEVECVDINVWSFLK